MPGSVSLTGKDVIVINGRVFKNFADGDLADLTFDGNLMNVKASRDGNTVYALNEDGRVSVLKLKLLLGSSDDKYLNSLLASMKADPAGFVLMVSTFTKRVGDGKGNSNLVVYQCVGGAFDKVPHVKSSAGGDTEQSSVMWSIKFGDSDRAVM
jgi:hypothetical protein